MYEVEEKESTTAIYHPINEEEVGFDITQFDGSEKVKELMEEFGLKKDKIEDTTYNGRSIEYTVFHSDDALVLTENDPIEGESSQGWDRKEGSMGYIRIQGKKEVVEKIKDFIVEHADSIKEGPDYESGYI